MTKITALFIAIVIVSSCGAQKPTQTSQEVKNTIRTDFNDYLESIVNKDFRKSMEYLMPEFFEIFPKEQMITVMEQTFNNPEMAFEIKDPKILEIQKVSEVENKFYSKLKYSNIMLMKMNAEEGETEEDREMTQSLLELSFGEGNVVYKSESESYQIYAEKEVIAVSSNGQTDWKFLVMEEKQKPILEKLVPKEVLEMK